MGYYFLTNLVVVLLFLHTSESDKKDERNRDNPTGSYPTPSCYFYKYFSVRHTLVTPPGILKN